jgi:hypothetical protein
MRRGIPLASLNPQQCAKPFRDQYSAAEELRQELEAQWAEEFHLADTEPDCDEDPEDVCRHLEILAELLTTPGKDA